MEDFISSLKLTSPMLTQGRSLEEVQEAKSSSDKDIEKASKDFEALLVQQMLSSWWKTVPSGGGISSSREEELFRDMLNQELSQQIADNDSLGVKDIIARELKGKGNLPMPRDHQKE
jgi:Rod binding domain-containing protein